MTNFQIQKISERPERCPICNRAGRSSKKFDKCIRDHNDHTYFFWKFDGHNEIRMTIGPIEASLKYFDVDYFKSLPLTTYLGTCQIIKTKSDAFLSDRVKSDNFTIGHIRSHEEFVQSVKQSDQYKLMEKSIAFI